MKKSRILSVLLTIILVTGCASSHKTADQVGKASEPLESRIEGGFPANSPFAKLKLGMAQGQVHEILGQPTDTKTYQTGKMWIPFYFGPDVMRLDEFYKGVGVLTFTGAGIGGVHWNLYRAVYNPAEDGYPDSRNR